MKDMNTKHFACKGCGAVSKHDGASCTKEGCEMHGKKMEECNCGNMAHGAMESESMEAAEK